ncbi:MAG: serine protease [Parvularculaceae bacterium]|nr:MAG: serine protease [Parvularculaceae bacterium]
MSRDDIEDIYHNIELFNSDVASPLLSAGDRVVYGADDRKDIYQLSGNDIEARQKQLVYSTVILTEKSNVSKNADGTWTLDVAPFTRNGHRPCSSERFGHQHVGGWCSGFMVGHDVIATAGHCGKTQQKIEDTAYIFGFHAISETDKGQVIFQENQVYFGKELIAHDLSPTGDFAIVRVDRSISSPGARILPVRTSGVPTIGGHLGVIGYPSGLPVKIAFGVQTVLIRDDDPWLIGNLDTYGGNSGSPVFNAEGMVEGILVRGARDYVLDGNCFRTNFLSIATGGEAITRASVFCDKIPSTDQPDAGCGDIDE